jgi:hypothetical protein
VLLPLLELPLLGVKDFEEQPDLLGVLKLVVADTPICSGRFLPAPCHVAKTYMVTVRSLKCNLPPLM